MYISKIARRFKNKGRGDYDEFLKLANRFHAQSSPLRNSNFDSVPIDKDSRNHLLHQEYPVILDESVILHPKIAEQISMIIEESKNWEILQDNNLEPSKSILFTGPPGVGKTLTAKLIAESLDLPLLVLDLSTVMSSFLGRTGNNIKNVFNYAKGMRCVLLLDEFDTIAKKRDDSSEIGELKRLVNVLLQEIDNWPSSSILIAATNHSNLLDPAIWRRFDRWVKFTKPNTDQIRELLNQRIELKDKDRWLVEALAEATNGDSFSGLARMVNSILKENIIVGTSIHDSIIKNTSNKLQDKLLDKKIRIKIAVNLKKQNIAERKISKITGLARETIRKYSSSQ